MDRTAIIVVTICVILLFTWDALLEKVSPTPPAQPQPTNAAPIQVPGQTAPPTTAPLRQAPPTHPPFNPGFQPPVKLDSPKLSILETADSSYIFTSEGGLKTVELKEPHVAMGKNFDLLWGTNNGDVNSTPIKLNHGVDLPVFALVGVDDSEFSINTGRNLVTMVSTNQAGIRITKELSVPTIGIGAGPGCDGQILVTQDMVGLFTRFRPRFVRRYLALAETLRETLGQYVADVKTHEFPSTDESY